MDDWTRYKQRTKAKSDLLKMDIEEVGTISLIIKKMVDRRHELNISQRELATMCEIPHSSIARIESAKTIPNLSTLIKIFSRLNLKIIVVTNDNI